MGKRGNLKFHPVMIYHYIFIVHGKYLKVLTQERLSLSTADNKWLCVCGGVCAQSCPTLCSPLECGSLSVGFCRQQYWCELPFPLPEDLPDPGIKPETTVFLHWQRILYHCATWEASSKSILVLPNKHWASLVAQRVKLLPEMQET